MFLDWQKTRIANMDININRLASNVLVQTTASPQFDDLFLVVKWERLLASHLQDYGRVEMLICWKMMTAFGVTAGIHRESAKNVPL